MDIGSKIKELRLENTLTQRELSKKIHIAQNTLSQIENNIANPSYEVLNLIADFFQCSTDYLLGREGDFGNITIQTEKPAPMPQDEQNLLDVYRKLDTVNKMHVSAYAEVRLEEQENRNPSTIRKNNMR